VSLPLATPRLRRRHAEYPRSLNLTSAAGIASLAGASGTLTLQSPHYSWKPVQKFSPTSASVSNAATAALSPIISRTCTWARTSPSSANTVKTRQCSILTSSRAFWTLRSSMRSQGNIITDLGLAQKFLFLFFFLCVLSRFLETLFACTSARASKADTFKLRVSPLPTRRCQNSRRAHSHAIYGVVRERCRMEGRFNVLRSNG